MEEIDLTQALLDTFNKEPRVRKVGRYNVSDLWAITNGYIKPEDYAKPQQIDFEGAMNMWQGTHKHAQIQELLDGHEIEVKEVITTDHDGEKIELVGKCDAMNEKFGLEIKTSAKLHEKSKKWHDYQAKIYCTLFKRDTFKIVQPCVYKGKLVLRVIGEVKRNDAWVAKQLDKLVEFHKEVKRLNTN